MTIVDEQTPKLLLRVSEAADLLSIAKSKAYAMVQSGELPSVKIGKSLRVPAEALTAYVQHLIETQRR